MVVVWCGLLLIATIVAMAATRLAIQIGRSIERVSIRDHRLMVDSGHTLVYAHVRVLAVWMVVAKFAVATVWLCAATAASAIDHVWLEGNDIAIAVSDTIFIVSIRSLLLLLATISGMAVAGAWGTHLFLRWMSSHLSDVPCDDPIQKPI